MYIWGGAWLGLGGACRHRGRQRGSGCQGTTSDVMGDPIPQAAHTVKQDRSRTEPQESSKRTHHQRQDLVDGVVLSDHELDHTLVGVEGVCGGARGNQGGGGDLGWTGDRTISRPVPSHFPGSTPCKRKGWLVCVTV